MLEIPSLSFQRVLGVWFDFFDYSRLDTFKVQLLGSIECGIWHEVFEEALARRWGASLRTYDQISDLLVPDIRKRICCFLIPTSCGPWGWRDKPIHTASHARCKIIFGKRLRLLGASLSSFFTSPCSMQIWRARSNCSSRFLWAISLSWLSSFSWSARYLEVHLNLNFLIYTWILRLKAFSGKY